MPFSIKVLGRHPRRDWFLPSPDHQPEITLRRTVWPMTLSIRAGLAMLPPAWGRLDPARRYSACAARIST